MSIAGLLPPGCASCGQAPALRRLLASRWIARRILRAQEQERARVAEELEDELTGPLDASLVRVRVLQVMTEEPVLRRELDEIRRSLDHGLTALRRAAAQAGPAALRAVGLEASISSFAERVAGPRSVAVAVHVTAADIPDPIAVGLFRIAQEALTNVVQHAGARHVDVRVDRIGTAVRLVVEDDGVGMNISAQPPARGVDAMRERAELLGGHLDLTSRPGRGTRVACVIPDAT